MSLLPLPWLSMAQRAHALAEGAAFFHFFDPLRVRSNGRARWVRFPDGSRLVCYVDGMLRYVDASGLFRGYSAPPSAYGMRGYWRNRYGSPVECGRVLAEIGEDGSGARRYLDNGGAQS